MLIKFQDFSFFSLKLKFIFKILCTTCARLVHDLYMTCARLVHDLQLPQFTAINEKTFEKNAVYTPTKKKAVQFNLTLIENEFVALGLLANAFFISKRTQQPIDDFDLPNSNWKNQIKKAIFQPTKILIQKINLTNQNYYKKNKFIF